MLILPKSCFLHVPKTGGTWVKLAIAAAGIPTEELVAGHNHHPGLANCPCPEKFKFAFVRHPVALYRSYWQFKMTYGWDPHNGIDTSCQSDDFQTFIRNVLQRLPGVYGHSLIDFVGPPERPIEFIGKFENLSNDLITALELAGEDFNADAIRALPPSNVSDKARFPAQYTPALEAAIRESEAGMMARFGYD